MNIKIEKVYERDVDLLVINNFSKGILIDLFLNRINKSEYRIESIEHSLQNQYGENDLTVILYKGNSKIALLIEDKIDAPAMDEQASRYNLRGNKLKEDKIVDEYYIFIIAPQKYLDGNDEAKKYPYKISYEELLNKIKDDYSKSIIERALDESKNGYIVDEDKTVTEFWKYFYAYVDDKYSGLLNIKISNNPRGSKARWPIFNIKTNKNIKIRYKADKGYVDLEFAGAFKNIEKFLKIFKEKGIDVKNIEPTGKSIVIRKVVSKLSFNESFDMNKEKITEALNAAVELQKLLEEQNLSYIYNEIMND